MKLKINPSARINRRYILIEAKSKNEIEKIILDYIGILGWARAAPVFVENHNGFVLAVERKSLENIRAAVELANTNVKILRVSGTLSGLQRVK